MRSPPMFAMAGCAGAPSTRCSVPPAFPRRSVTCPPGPPGVATVSPARVAFATLDVAEQQLLEAVLFDGYTATELADSLGIAAMEIRRCLGAAMLALGVMLVDEPGDPGAVTAMLAL